MFKDQNSFFLTHRVNRVLLDSVPDPDLEMGGGGVGEGGAVIQTLS